jgi:hypothetical protein
LGPFLAQLVTAQSWAEPGSQATHLRPGVLMA